MDYNSYCSPHGKMCQNSAAKWVETGVNLRVIRETPTYANLNTTMIHIRFSKPTPENTNHFIGQLISYF